MACAILHIGLDQRTSWVLLFTGLDQYQYIACAILYTRLDQYAAHGTCCALITPQVVERHSVLGLTPAQFASVRGVSVFGARIHCAHVGARLPLRTWRAGAAFHPRLAVSSM